MTRSRRVVGWMLAGMIVALSMLLVTPVGSATSRRSVPPPPPAGERSPVVGQLLPLPFTLVPAVALAGTQIKVLGNGFATCATVHGEIVSAGNGDVSGVVAGDVFLYWDGVDPVRVVHLDEYLEYAANVELAQAAVPGGRQAVHGCVDEEGGMGSADGTVPAPAGVAPGPVSPDPADAVRSQRLADAPAPGSGAKDQARADAVAGLADPRTGEVRNQPLSASTGGAASENLAESRAPATGPASWGLLIGVLTMVGAALVVPSAISFALQNRKGPNWVRANVRAEAAVAPAVVEMTPQIDCPWPTFGVRLALRTDSGTQALTEVEQ